MDDYKNPRAGKTYISPRLNDFYSSNRNVRIASKVIDSPDSYAFTKIEEEVLLRHNEPPRDCRRLNILREYDNEKTNLHS